MKKEEIPKLFSFDLINIIITIVSFIALFSFWNEMSDFQKVLFIVIPFGIVTIMINFIKYYIKVKNLYKTYKKLYNNNQALAEIYKENIRELKQEQYNNEVLRDFSQKTIDLLLVYNDFSKDEQKKLRRELITYFISGTKGKGDNNEKKI